MVDKDLVELIEYHPCPSGSNWLLYQYQNSSELIVKAKRDGNKHTYICKTGNKPINLKASINAAGIEEISIDEDKKEVRVTHIGLAGAGVGAGMCRGMGEGVKYVELLEVGGGCKVGKATIVTPKYEKIVIGIDDTDTKNTGATWTMAHNVGLQLQKEGFEYLNHIIVQLFPNNPHKTQNCVSIALTFAVMEDKKQILIDRIIEILKKNTSSDKTSIAILEGIGIPPKLREYAIATKTRMMNIETAEKLADELNIYLIAITGDQGKVGALAALGLHDDVDEAVKIYY